MRILVVGAGGELGTAVARRLASDGHELVLHALSDVSVLNDIADQTGTSRLLTADVRSEPSVEAMMSQAAGQDGLDGLVYAAGVNQTAMPIADTPLADWNHTISVNLTGAFLCVKSALPYLRRSAGGSIVLVSSVFGMNSPAHRGAYGVSKHGLSGLVQSVSKEEAPLVRVNAVCPGPMWTENVRRIFAQHAKSVGISVEDYVKQRRAQIPSGRFLELGECASLIAYLLSERSRFLTGESIRLAGGES
jgi:NAD(P)-dependent dehydrogenase (short-subunit alcohol dehydrogenase family)